MTQNKAVKRKSVDGYDSISISCILLYLEQRLSQFIPSNVLFYTKLLLEKKIYEIFCLCIQMAKNKVVKRKPVDGYDSISISCILSYLE